MARTESGFSLVEVLVAMLLLSSGGLAAAAALHQVSLALAASRHATLIVAAASAKVAQFDALVWEYEERSPGVLTSATDSQTDLAASSFGAGGTGIFPADGHDHLGAAGEWAGGGTAQEHAVLSRRWRVRPHGGSPDLLTISVEVESRSVSAGMRPLIAAMAHDTVAVRVRMVR